MRMFTLAASFMAFGLPAFAGEMIDSQVDIKGIKQIELVVPSGNVVVRGGDNQQIQITGELAPSAKEWVFEKQGNKLVAEVRMPKNWDHDEPGSSIDVSLPVNISLDAEGVTTSFAINNLKGDLEVGTVTGKLTLNSIKGDVEAESVSGNIVATQLDGEIELASVSGEITGERLMGKGDYASVSGDLTLLQVGPEVDVETVSGDIKLQSPSLSQLSLETVSGSIDANVLQLINDAEIEVDTVSGSVALHLPQSAVLEMKLETGPGGKIVNELNDASIDISKYSRSASMRFEPRNSQGQLELHTISGTLTLSPSSNQL